MNRSGIAAGLISAFLLTNTSMSTAATMTLSFLQEEIEGLPGYTAHIMNLAIDTGVVNAMELDVLASSLNQVQPEGVSTIFQENNIFLDYLGMDPRHDTQLLFNRSIEAVHLIRAAESDRHVDAVFGLRGDAGFTNRDIARIVLPDNGAANYHLKAVSPQEGRIVEFSGRIGDPSVYIWPLDYQPPEPEPTITDVTGEITLSLKSSEPTPGLPGYTTYTLAMTSSGVIGSLKADLQGSAIRQIDLNGTQTVFNNLNNLILQEGEEPKADTQLLFSQLNYPLMNLFIASESEQHLYSEVVFPKSQRYLGGDLLQVVLADGDLAVLDLGVSDGSSTNFRRVIGQIGGDAELVLIPEPTTLTTLLALSLLRRRRAA
ncbi:MAG: hypothetical protein RIG82_05625 [Phycisphaeraceae bacterium]